MEQDTKHHILYVDDEENNLTVFKSSFRRDYHVHTALSAAEGLEILKTENIHVIITDQRMPNVTGVEFLKSIPPDLEFMGMILTAYTDVQAIIEALNLRFVYRYITKPWDKDELKFIIDSAIDNLELRESNKRLFLETEVLNKRIGLALNEEKKKNAELKLANVKIEENEKKFKAFTNQASEGITVADLEGKYVFVNPAFCSMSGYTREELLNMTLFEMTVNKVNKEKFYKKIKKIEDLSGEVKLKRKDKTEYLIEYVVKTINVDDQILLLGNIRDITERRQVEEELEKHRNHLEELVKERTTELQIVIKELEAFAYSISHDLRAPLRAIGGYTRILMDDYMNNFDSEGKRIGRVIEDNARKMGNLIDDLLSFSRLGRKEMHFSEIDMKNMVNSIYHEVVNEEERKRISFTIGDLPKTIADTNMMRQVWINLISNAVKFSSKSEKGIISVTCKEEDNKFVFCIKDNGVGFNMKYKDKLFGVFQRLHGEKEFEGTGVGLALVERIIQRHNGEVWGEAIVGEGAEFYFSLKNK